MNSGASEHFKRYLRRSQSGQSLVILAIGFFALVGFVGIVTDVSILFVRYSTLRRAVDAAAVAAAGQMRRVEAATAGEDQAQSYANMGLAARQFIEFYGLNPSSVTVETCHVQNEPSGTPDPALCTQDERKLVRVTAQIDSPTTFFSLFGFNTIRLQAESISETAVLDLVFIMDVSESMLNETSYADWETVPQPDGSTVDYGRRYLPPVLQYPGGANYNNMALAWQRLVSSSNQLILQNVLDATGDGSLVADLAYAPSMTKVRTYGTGLEPRRECTVRFWPGSALKESQITPAQIDQYVSDLGGVANFRSWFGITGDIYSADWRGLVPMYDYYGCCNDPNGDWDMSDLVCQPFRRARDASIDFMGRLDFIRGDRVAIVTFDRNATLMDPDPSDTDPEDSTRSDTRDAMIYSQEIAELVMNERVGVRTENNFYVDSASPARDGRWDRLRDNGVPRDLGYFATAPIQNIVDQPVRNACPYDMAILPYPYSLYRDQYDTTYRSPFALPALGIPAALPVLLDEVDTLPAWFEAYTPAGGTFMRQSVDTGSWEFVDRLARSYEYRGSCAGTNIGEGLGKASETLGRLGRREGAVWIMVLLSDGAAGASSPVWRNGTLAQPPQPYNPSGVGAGTQPATAGLGQQYGSFGLCPYGSDINNAGELLQDKTFPYCSDIQPQSRHYCSDDNAGTAETLEQRGPNRIDLTDQASCETFYDVDDYARDWADYISVRGINVYQSSVTGIDVIGNDADTLLPTIFTIGFGLEFDSTTGCITPGPTGNTQYDCNMESYLGEELLRYIADAGDNFRIDSDYWQEEMGYRIPNRVSDLAPGQDPDWGIRGPCEQPTGVRGVWAPLAPGEDCGNYFSAESGSSADLNAVFAEIASRMFTRLSG
ncbi:MAG: hypothetical protein IT320_01685 [Anaerolineae bacterium]|nr:hypothetical protein [Anaerolineae bacterium]